MCVLSDRVLPADLLTRTMRAPGRQRAAASGPRGAYRRRRPGSRVTSSAIGRGADTRRDSRAPAAAARPGTRT